jgi:pantoate--beta-alanine ligase
MSSRNGYLSKEQRQLAPKLHATLSDIHQAISKGDYDFETLEGTAKIQLSELGFKPDYLHIYHRDNLRPAKKADKDLVIVAAAFLGTTRLIDNLHVHCV